MTIGIAKVRADGNSVYFQKDCVDRLAGRQKFTRFQNVLYSRQG